MLLAVLIALARAEDASGARPGAGPPSLRWGPVAAAIVGTEAMPTADGIAAFATIAARGGVEVERKVFRARLSVQGSQAWALGGETRLAGGSNGMELGEAWLSWSPPLSSALGLTTAAGVQPLDYDGGVLIGTDDRRLTARLPLAGLLVIRAEPWRLDGLVGLASGPAPTVSELGAEHEDRIRFGGARLSIGRENPVWAWEVAATALEADDGTADGRLTAGVASTADLNRVRLDGAAFFQEGAASVGVLARGRAGLALGDESRVVVWAGFLARGTDTNPTFARPLGTRGRFGGWAGLLDRDGTGALRDAFVDLDATLAPPLRLTAEAHHHWLDGGAFGPELDLDLVWYWSPLGALRLRGSALVPWAEAAPVELGGTLTLEGSLP